MSRFIQNLKQKQTAPTLEQQNLTIAERLIAEAMERVRMIFPKECFQWAKEHPEYMKGIDDTGEEVDAAYLAKDLPRYRQAVIQWEKGHMALYRSYCRYCKKNGLPFTVTEADAKVIEGWFQPKEKNQGGGTG
ncbi:hypothetical protein [Desulforamulus ruminis]|uniref:hypothetical protein n=1 Tax=Desulforamulus ruminis TaxID=1564 RepID=UPI002357278A|nr:hypothetical protein [Desulforamulus ruminis]